jgi:molecular chaperone DnaK
MKGAPLPIGIDLGTTFSVAAYVDEKGAPNVIPNELGSALTPSVVCFESGVPIIGRPAKDRQAVGEPVAAFFKRQMGVEHWSFADGEREYSAIELSGFVLAQLKRDAERALGCAVREAVITVPAYFRSPQREATLAAGKQAGLHVLQVVNEPTAAAVAFGCRAKPEAKPLLVYDLGGGTFDVTLLRLDEREIRVLTSDGDHELGGKDWDDRIVEHLASRFRDEFGVDPLADVETIGELLIRAEQTKQQLSAATSARLTLAHAGSRGNYTLDRAGFERITADLMERTLSLCRKVLAEQKMTARELGGVLLVGGSTRMPMVARSIEEAFGRAPLGGVDVDKAVALGAALVAAEHPERAARSAAPMLSLAGRRTVDVTNHSLGMIAVNEAGDAYINSVVLPKNRTIPCVLGRPYQQRGGRRGNSSLEVYVTQGESASPADVTYLGKHVIHDIPASDQPVTVVDIEYAYDLSGTVQVSAKERTTQHVLRVSREPLPSDVPARFAAAPASAAREHLTVYLAFDLSGSMEDEPLEEAKEAALEFLGNIDLGHTSVGIITFADSADVQLAATQNARQIEAAIDALEVLDEGTDGDPFGEILSGLEGARGARYAIVLTDGEWGSKGVAIERAEACHRAGIEIIAIGFGDADSDFLEEIASSSEVSFFTQLEDLTETFSTIAQVLTESGGALAPSAIAAGAKRRGLAAFSS